MSYITFQEVCKVYGTGDSAVRAADNVTFGIEKGELLRGARPQWRGKNHSF